MTRAMLILAGLLAGVSPGRSASPTVEAVAPPVGQRGTEFTVTLTGSRLGDPREILFYRPGLTCERLAAESENEVRATLRAAADCPLGEHPIRLRTAGGTSELRVVYVSPLPVVAEVEPEDGGPRAPLAVPLNSTVVGRIGPAEVDDYTVTLKKGERLSAEVVGVRLCGGEVVDTVLSVVGPDGRELASVDDTPLHRQDPLASLIAPADGTYTVRVRDANFGGGDGYWYALHVGTFVRPAFVFPVGGPAGQSVPVALHGDPSGPIVRPVDLPAAGEPFEFYPSDDNTTTPTPVPFRVCPFPNVVEAEPNDTPARATAAAAWPVAFNGTIAAKGDVDHYRFPARAGDVIQVEAFASRVGSPLDPVVTVLDGSGQVIGFGDDDQTHDSKFRVAIPADGEYTVRVSDKRGQGGPAFVYRVELDRPRPDLAVFLPAPVRKSQDRQTIAVPRGNRVTAFLAVRRSGVEGEVALEPRDLPTGVTLTAAPIPPDQYYVPVVFEAEADAPLGGALVEVIGTARGPDGSLIGGFEQVIDGASGPGDTAFHSVRVDRLAVAVVDAAPYAVEIVPPVAALAPGGSLELALRVTRDRGFSGPVEVALPFLPPGVEAEPAVAVPEGQSEAVMTLSAQPDTPPGEWRLVASAKAATPPRARRDRADLGGGGAVMGLGFAAALGRRPRSAPAAEEPWVASAATRLTISDPPVKGQFAATVAEQGRTVSVTCRLEPSSVLPSGAQATLDGLPPRATAEPVEVTPGASGVEFAVKIDPTTPTGDHDSLVCRVEGRVGGQPVVYRVGRGGLLRVIPPGGVKVDAAGNPLSPLDALRLEAKGKTPE